MKKLFAKLAGIDEYAVVVVDDIYFAKLSKHKWYIDKDGYAFRNAYFGKINGRYIQHVVKMHRLIAGAKDGDIVDHRNGNTLDNTSINLRLCTARENAQNRAKHRNTQSKFKGVYKSGNKFIAKICVDGFNRYLGSFATAQDAKYIYEETAKKEFHEFYRQD